MHTPNTQLTTLILIHLHGHTNKHPDTPPFLQSSIWVCEWALEWWAEGTQVALAEELLPLKAQIRAANMAAPPVEEQS